MTLIDQAMRAAVKERQAEQRYDKARAEYRLAHRAFCVSLAALEAKKGSGTAEFSRFYARYQEDAKKGTLEQRSPRELQYLRQSGMLDVPQDVVLALDPTFFIVAAKRVYGRNAKLPADVAIHALYTVVKADTTKGFGLILDGLAQQYEVLEPTEQVLPPKPRKIRKEAPTLEEEAADLLDSVDIDAATANTTDDPEDEWTPEELAAAPVTRAAVAEQVEAIRQVIDACNPHPALTHLQRAKSSLQKMRPLPEQNDDLLLLSMEINALLDLSDTLTDADIQNFLTAEGDEK